jgi:hypothetical protein
LGSDDSQKVDGSLTEYNSSLWLFNDEYGTSVNLLDDLRDCDFYFADYFAGKLYVTTQIWAPYSEFVAGPVYSIDEQSIEVSNIFNQRAAIVAFTQKTAYSITDSMELMTIHLHDDSVTKICKLPDENPKEQCDVQKIVNNKMALKDGWDNTKYYTIDLDSGIDS